MYKIPANTLFTAQKLIYVPECHSTNSLLTELNGQTELPEGTVVITNRQTAGRGQRGNSWDTEPGKNLTCSILLRPRFMQAKDQFQLNMAVSLAAATALNSHIADIVKLKWPNDIFVGNKKIGGILIESQLQGNSLFSSIVGIGLNVNQERFDHPNAMSLFNIAGSAFDLNATFQKLMEYLEAEYLDLRAGNTLSLKQRYLDTLYKFGESQDFEAQGKNFTGYINDVDEQGKLCVESGGVTQRFSFKEVRFLS